MANEEQTLDQISWLLWIIISVLGILITGMMLYREVRKRQDETCTFVSNTLRFTSIVCMWSSLMLNVSILLSVIPGFCMMDRIPIAIAIAIMFTSLGFYQLGRLHFSFCRDRVRSDKGYPLWIFMVMIIIGIVLGLSLVVMSVFIDSHPLKCGWSARPGTFFFWENQRAIFSDGMYDVYAPLVLLCVPIWDFTTLLMYVYKIWKIGTFYKSKDNDIWSNILSILHRIVIVTLFYQITGPIVMAIFYAMAVSPVLGDKTNIVFLLQYNVPQTFHGILFSLIICLMMEHNSNEYIAFLRFLRKFRLHLICVCCCRRIVDQQLEELTSSEKKSPKVTAMKSEETAFSNISKLEVYAISAPKRSMETQTAIEQNELPGIASEE